MKFHKPKTKKARIEIIPMIDAIFFLLVFFMFSSLSMVKMGGVGLDLPTTGAARPSGSAPAEINPSTVVRGTEYPKLVVTLNERGEYFLNRTRVSAATMSQALAQEAVNKPGAVAIVNVAKGQTTQSLIDLIDAVNRVKLPSGQTLPVLVATEPVDADGNALPAAPPTRPRSTP